MRPLRLGGLLVAIALLIGSACGSAPPPRTVEAASAVPMSAHHGWRELEPTTTTQPPAPPPVVTVPKAAPTPKRVAAPRVTSPAQPAVDEDFWRRVANCESPDGRSGTFLGYFQFSRDTAAKIGYRAGMSYEEQRALAIKWLAMIGGRGGSTSGWPICWWVALRG